MHFLPFQKNRLSTAAEQKYSLEDFVKNYNNKKISNNFYKKYTKEIVESLQTVPVYFVLNGYSEIVSADPVLQYSKINTLSEKMYDFFGVFNGHSNKVSKLGLFFLDQRDAMMYLQKIAQEDSLGTGELGLSIHCRSLGSVYELIRDYDPEIDFRFVPNLTELTNLLKSNNISDSRFVFDKNQQQNRFRKYPVNVVSNIISGTRKVEDSITPFSSFFQSNEYFKGVPIYLVQLSSESSPLLTNGLSLGFNIVDTLYCKFIKVIDRIHGVGQSSIVFDNTEKTFLPPSVDSYVFFEKQEALKFVRNNGRRVISYAGSYSEGITMNQPILNPKIYISNLEDFLEAWEDSILINGGASDKLFTNLPFNFNSRIHFVSENYPDTIISKNIFQSFQENLKRKARILGGYTSFFLNNN